MVLQHAIVVRDAVKGYGNGAVILNHLNLCVPKGAIYSLLGPSGCGKTTLLSSVVGVRKLDSGEIWVLGGAPGSKESGIPGPRVGYMPQEISLVDEFSAIGALYYFGRINGLDDETIEERYNFLKDLLQLPPRNRLVRNMSGGQQRRVSFAAALLHKPELLVLDEPTVGLDPVLRDNIWHHLVKITRDEGVTVVITTHYIEEAKQSDKIGLMRGGKLLAESSPNELLERFQTDSLEEAFLTLSRMQVQNQAGGVGPTPISGTEVGDVFTLDAVYNNATKNKISRAGVKKKFHALFTKNVLQFVRHPGGILFSILLPVLQMILFFNSYGLDPKGLSISIINEEAGNCDFGRNFGNVTYDETDFSCAFVDLSCRITNGFNDTFLKKVYYDDYNKAVEEVTKQKSIGVMHFSRNFSYALQNKLKDIISVSDADIISSQIRVSIYTPDRQIGLFVQKNLYDIFFREYKKVMKECHISPKVATVPIHFEDPVFGTNDQKYITFITPPFIMSLLFVLATSMTSSIIITDRHSGVWDRTLVQGVTTGEILITHLITQMMVVVIKVTTTLCVCFFQFEMECKGSLTAAMWLALLGGICGMSYGFFISVMCTNHALVNYAAVGSFYPLILLSGLMWPVEGMPKLLRWISLSLPLTLPGISLRGVLEKGRTFYDPEVYHGFMVLSAWILGFIILCLFQLRSKAT
ncbi:ABC transporter G family member 20 [Nomia melanderi]|uniref:ABC transporter G family member 20 n=1 Tax=Nomia melanderi TaxID=2448451 RepID=UPI0013042D3A|nr:ABC transporter G family member 20-like [Nomia melanderi]XP_031844823.1 ABC transporter G family member 20-like [Nomia melanderi]XP_031844824.1 ABC transporter G family member 20-like [Nomia melanderi]